MQQITLREPRTLTRMVYQMAMQSAASEGARRDLAEGLQWYEWKWAHQDQQAAQQAAAPPPSPPTLAPPSAVETHGVDSPEAEAKRQRRREKRLAEKAAKAAGVAEAD
jgi:hypothetical protein